MAKGADGSIIIDTALDSSGFNAGSAKLSKACDSLINKVGNMSARLQGGFVSGSGLDKMAERTATVQHEIDVLQEKLKALGDTPIKTDDYAGLEQALKKAENELLRYQDRQNLMRDMGIDEASAQWQRLAIQISNTEAIIRQYRAEMAYLEQSGQATIEGSQTEQFTALQRRITEAKERLREFNAEQNKMAASGARLERVNNVFKRIGKGIKNAIKRLFSFNRASRSSAGATNGLIKQLTSLKTLLVSRIKRTFITQIINTVRESLQVLARYSREFNTSISGIRNAFKELGANIGVALSGILNAVAPIVTQIINWLSKIITYISAFIAMLSGKNTITVAKKQNESYAKSLDKTAKAANKAQLALAGFDELNNLTTQKDSGGSGGTSPSSMFEEKEIGSILPELIRNWFGKLKTAIQSGDWYGVGATIAEGLNAAVNKLDDWIANTLEPKGMKMASNLAKGINGFFEKFDSRKLGQSIAHGINAAVRAARTFLKETDFQKIGASITEFINGALETFDWAETAQTILDGLMGITTIVTSVLPLIIPTITQVLLTIVGVLIDNIPQMTDAALQLVMGLAQGIINAIPVIVAALPQVISSLIDGLLEAIPQIIQAGIDLLTALVDALPEIITVVVEAIPQIIDGIVTALIENIPQIVQAGIDLLVALIKALPQIITTIVKAIPRIISGIVNALIDNIDKIIMAGVQLFVALIENLPTIIVEIVKAVPQIVSGIVQAFASLGGEMIKAGSNLLHGLWEGISGAASWLWEKVSGWASSLVSGVKDLFGIHSPSKVFARIGEFIMRGLYVGIDGEKDTALKSVADIASTMEDTFGASTFDVNTSAFDGVLAVLDRIAEKIGEITDSLGNLRMPAMATGEVIPYRAKIADAAYTDGGRGDSDLKQIIIDALRALGLDNMTVQVLLDGQKVYDSVVDYSKRDISRTGRYPILGE